MVIKFYFSPNVEILFKAFSENPVVDATLAKCRYFIFQVKPVIIKVK